MEHLSVLKESVQKYLELKGGEIVVDTTLGLGGHALEMVQAIGKEGKLYAFDQDERNMEEAKRRLKDYEGQITYIHDNFRYLKSRVTGEVDAILFDLGLSSPHVDEADRGFSFQQDGPLDMRFDPRSDLTAATILNTYSEEKLAEIFFKYAEEKQSHKLARYIVQDREEELFESTLKFAAFVERVLRQKRASKKSKAHPATRVFQALGIEVNNEMGVLEEALEAAMEIVKVGGRIVLISYHSIEDRLVKHFFRKLENPPVSSPEQAAFQTHGDPIVEKMTRKPVIPTDQELEENPRSRSAKLRAYKKLLPYPS
ncbi:16S rRNA (cytosine(1402)-N(4))-methyltransferase RsmH [Candidatus Gracilibacteria bacterium]|nr:16S rRNA (cytosine(1402)-N(4))-methyltransferase RsmH [Candidatus Gracilibacteria bacterium]